MEVEKAANFEKSMDLVVQKMSDRIHLDLLAKVKWQDLAATCLVVVVENQEIWVTLGLTVPKLYFVTKMAVR